MTITETPVQTYIELPLDDVNESCDNLRQDIGNLDDLVASIHALGIIEPLIVDTDHVLLAGHRRLAAAKQAGLTTVPCVVRNVLTEAEITEIMLVENLCRAGLNPIEEGTGYARLTECGLSQREIAERVGCNQSHVSKRITLTELPDTAKVKVIDGTLHVNDALKLVVLVKADAASADEWIAGQRWPDIDERLRRARTEIQKQASLVEGQASKLPYADYPGPEHGILPSSDGASCWTVTSSGALVWLETIAAGKATKPAKPSKPKPAPVPTPIEENKWEIERQKTIARRERRDETLHAAVGHVGRERLVAISFELAVRTAAETDYDVIVDTGALPDDLDQDDHVLVVAWRLMKGLTDAICLPDAADYDRWALAFLVELGYDLDEDEQAALGEFVVPTVTSWEHDGPCEQIADHDEIDAAVHADEPVDDADALAMAEADDWMEAKPPWSAYPFVDEVKLIGAIREHGNATKLDYAIEFERAHQNRPAVIVALGERIVELRS